MIILRLQYFKLRKGGYTIMKAQILVHVNACLTLEQWHLLHDLIIENREVNAYELELLNLFHQCSLFEEDYGLPM